MQSAVEAINRNTRSTVHPAQDTNDNIETANIMYSPVNRDEVVWSREAEENSLPEAFSSVNVVSGTTVPYWRTFSAFVGPGFMIAVGVIYYPYTDIHKFDRIDRKLILQSHFFCLASL
jgi:hypothetical protein